VIDRQWQLQCLQQRLSINHRAPAAPTAAVPMSTGDAPALVHNCTPVNPAGGTDDVARTVGVVICTHASVYAKQDHAKSVIVIRVLLQEQLKCRLYLTCCSSLLFARRDRSQWPKSCLCMSLVHELRICR